MSNPEKPSGPSSEDRDEEFYREGLKRAHEATQAKGLEIGQLVMNLSDDYVYKLKSVENGIATVWMPAGAANNPEDIVKQFPYAELIDPKEVLKGGLEAKMEAALGPVLTAEEIEKEELERYEWWMANNPVVEIPQVSPETGAEKVAEAECEAMLDSFEQSYDLEALRAITQLDSIEKRKSSIRQLALDELTLMYERMNYLGRFLHSETRKAFGVRYEKLSNAVGNTVEIKGEKDFNVIAVIHNRRTPYPGDELPK